MTIYLKLSMLFIRLGIKTWLVDVVLKIARVNLCVHMKLRLCGSHAVLYSESNRDFAFSGQDWGAMMISDENRLGCRCTRAANFIVLIGACVGTTIRIADKGSCKTS